MTKARVNGTTSNAKGDLVVGTGSTTAAALSVGTDGQVLTAASGQTTGLQWATPVSGSMTLLSTTSLAGSASTTISSISQSYTHLYIYMYGITCSTNQTGLIVYLSSGYGYTASVQNYDAALSFAGDTYIRPAGNSYLKQNLTNNGFGLTIQNYTASGLIKPFTTSGWYTPSSGTYISINGGGGIVNNTTVTSITIDNGGYPNWTSGTVKIYGVN